ncbi:MAG: hypothetical protein K2G49_11590 [Muribaculum sp.]|nr:hypothetical protein [Muribaculum sp.]
MIPLGNIMPGDTCPWVSLRSTHGYKSDHPLRGCRHIYVIAGRNAGELPLAPTLPVWTILDGALQITQTLHRVAVGATGRSPATQTMRKRDLSPQGIIHV